MIFLSVLSCSNVYPSKNPFICCWLSVLCICTGHPDILNCKPDISGSERFLSDANNEKMWMDGILLSIIHIFLFNLNDVIVLNKDVCTLMFFLKENSSNFCLKEKQILINYNIKLVCFKANVYFDLFF